MSALIKEGIDNIHNSTNNVNNNDNINNNKNKTIMTMKIIILQIYK